MSQGIFSPNQNVNYSPVINPNSFGAIAGGNTNMNFSPANGTWFSTGNNAGLVPMNVLGANELMQATAGTGGLWNSFSNFMEGDTGRMLFGGTNADGVASVGALPVLGNLASGIMGAWNGMQQLDLAKDQFAFQKQAFNKNWGAQTKLLNSQMRDRQNARNAADDAAYQDTADYMRENEVK